MLDYQDLLDIGLAQDEAELEARLVSAVAHLGFGLCGGALIRGRLASRKASVHSFGNPPDGFVEAFTSLDAGIQDALMAAMQSRPGCYVYDQAFYARAGAAELWEVQAAFGYRHGMAVSSHEHSHAEMFCFGVDSPDPIATNAVERLRLQGHLGLIAQHAEAAAKRLHTRPSAIDLNAVSKDEVESLKWASDAESVWLTRGKVVISNHWGAQRKAVAKLGATSTPMAILRAIEGGLIER